MNTIAQFARNVACACVLSVLAGCASLQNPYVAPEKPTVQNPTLANAVGYAEDTRQKYYEAIKEHSQFNRLSGAALIGAAAAATILGIGENNGTEIAALGVSGAGLFSLHSLLYKDAKLRAYLEGAKAIGCTLSVYAPMRSVKESDLKDAVDDLESRTSAVIGAIAEVPGAYRRAAEVLKAKDLVSSANQSLEQGLTAIGLLDGAGINLYDAVQAIRTEVYTALVTAEPNIAELIQSLQKNIPTNAALITGVSLPGAPTGADKFRGDPPQSLIELEKETAELELKIRLVNGLVDQVGAAPDPGEVENCGIDAVESGINFAVQPTSQLRIDANSSNLTADIMISGGKTPYRARWVGRVPGEKVSLAPVDHNVGGADVGVAKITVVKGAVTDTYLLNLSDSGRGSTTISVHIDGENGTKASTGGNPIVSEDLKLIQQALAEKKCMAKDVDGVWGDKTNEGLLAYLKAAGMVIKDFTDIVGIPGTADANYKKFFDNVMKGDAASCETTSDRVELNGTVHQPN